MRVGTSGGLADLQRLRRAGIGEEGTAGFLVEKYRKKGTDPPEQGESPEKVIDMLCLHREKPLVRTSTCLFLFPPQTLYQIGSIVPDWAHGPMHLVTLSGHSCTPSLRRNRTFLDRDWSDVLGQKHSYDYSAFLPAYSHLRCPSILPSSLLSLCCRYQQKPRAESRQECTKADCVGWKMNTIWVQRHDYT